MNPFARSLLLICLAAPLAQAKLPPLSPEAQVKADEAKAKAAWTDKVSAYQLCKSMDRVAEGYLKRVKASASSGASAASAPGAPVATPPCTDPGPFVAAAPAASKPLEAAGAHSPPATAATPPSTNATQAQIQGQKK